jgi:hypothetical protein
MAGPIRQSLQASRNKGAVAIVSSRFVGVSLEQCFDETAGLEFVECAYRLPEHFVGDLPGDLFEVMVGDELDDQFTLLIGAVPTADAIGFDAVALDTIDRLMPVSVVPVVGVRNKSGLLNLFIHRLLECFVQTGAFSSHVLQVGDLGLAGDRELVTPVRF